MLKINANELFVSGVVLFGIGIIFMIIGMIGEKILHSCIPALTIIMLIVYVFLTVVETLVENLKNRA